MRDFVLIYLNGERVEVRGADSFLMLADWLRQRRGLTGTKIVCAEGDCGACTVLRAPVLSASPKNELTFESVNACIMTVAQADGCSIVTVEGLALNQRLNPVQEAMRACHGSQCGFCTPGFVVALTGAADRCSPRTGFDVKEAMNHLTGNLCRCTGYQPIQEAAAAVRWDKAFSPARRYGTPQIRADLAAAISEGCCVTDGVRTFFAPARLADALKTLAKAPRKTAPGARKPGAKGRESAPQSPAVRLIAGGTDLGVMANKGKLPPLSLISLQHIPELHKIVIKGGSMQVGAQVTLSALRHACEKPDPELTGLLNIFASPQIKHVATLVGNIANGSPIGDTMPHLLAADAELHLASLRGGRVVRRSVPLSAFYTGYRQTALNHGEIITHVGFRLPGRNEVCRTFKASQRKDMDISAVCGAFRATIHRPAGKSPTLSDVRVAFGGIAATPVRLPDVEQALTGLVPGSHGDQALAARAAMALQDAIRPIDDARASEHYRRFLAESFLRRFVTEALP